MFRQTDIAQEIFILFDGGDRGYLVSGFLCYIEGGNLCVHRVGQIHNGTKAPGLRCVRMPLREQEQR